MCSAPCDDDSDCAATQACANNSITIDGVGGVLKVCEPDTSLPEVPCDENADCAPTGRECNALAQPGGADTDLVLVCGFPATGAAIGAPCSGALVADAGECATGLCDGDLNGQCTLACNSDDDCDDAFGFLCTGTPFSNIAGRVCQDACTKEADCADAGRSCQLRNNVVEDLVDLVCAEDRGTKAAGEGAVDAGECQTAFVLILEGGDRICTQMCQVSTDCADAGTLTACGDLDIETPTGGLQTVRGCILP
jgi:hypothetical protein